MAGVRPLELLWILVDRPGFFRRRVGAIGANLLGVGRIGVLDDEPAALDRAF